ncbi:MAG: hypothetical protein ABIJ21_06425 [Nanoarchaeota archaeon]
MKKTQSFLMLSIVGIVAIFAIILIFISQNDVQRTTPQLGLVGKATGIQPINPDVPDKNTLTQYTFHGLPQPLKASSLADKPYDPERILVKFKRDFTFPQGKRSVKPSEVIFPSPSIKQLVKAVKS